MKKRFLIGMMIATVSVIAMGCTKHHPSAPTVPTEDETTTEYVTEVETTTEEVTTEEITTEEVTTEEETTTEEVTTVEETTEVVTTVAPTEAPTTAAPTEAPTQTSGTYKGKNFAQLSSNDTYTCNGQSFKGVGWYNPFPSPYVFETPYGDLLCQAEIDDIYGNNYKANVIYKTDDNRYTLFSAEDCVACLHQSDGNGYSSGHYDTNCLQTTLCGDAWFHLADGTKVKRYDLIFDTSKNLDAYMFLSQYEFDNFYKYLDSEFVEYVKVEYPQWNAEKFSCYAGRIEAYDTNHIPNSPINNLKINEVWHDIF